MLEALKVIGVIFAIQVPLFILVFNSIFTRLKSIESSKGDYMQKQDCRNQHRTLQDGIDFRVESLEKQLRQFIDSSERLETERRKSYQAILDNLKSQQAIVTSDLRDLKSTIIELSRNIKR